MYGTEKWDFLMGGIATSKLGDERASVGWATFPAAGTQQGTFAMDTPGDFGFLEHRATFSLVRKAATGYLHYGQDESFHFGCI